MINYFNKYLKKKYAAIVEDIQKAKTKHPNELFEYTHFEDEQGSCLQVTINGSLHTSYTLSKEECKDMINLLYVIIK